MTARESCVLEDNEKYKVWRLFSKRVFSDECSECSNPNTPNCRVAKDSKLLAILFLFSNIFVHFAFVRLR